MGTCKCIHARMRMYVCIIYVNIHIYIYIYLSLSLSLSLSLIVCIHIYVNSITYSLEAQIRCNEANTNHERYCSEVLFYQSKAVQFSASIMSASF